MSVMPVNNLLTREELDAWPGDGLRHELIDGAFVMTPAPGVGHQRTSAALVDVLRAAARVTALEVLYAPVNVVIGSSVVEPVTLNPPASLRLTGPPGPVMIGSNVPVWAAFDPRIMNRAPPEARRAPGERPCGRSRRP